MNGFCSVRPELVEGGTETFQHYALRLPDRTLQPPDHFAAGGRQGPGETPACSGASEWQWSLQTSALLYLAAAGVGTLGVIANDSGAVFSAFAPDQRETVSAALTGLNPDCTVVIHGAMDPPSPEQIVRGYDLVLSPPGPLHEVCYALRRPFLCAQASAIDAWVFLCTGYEPDSPCLRCLPRHLFEERTNMPLLAPLFLGTLQATEAIKLILGLSRSSTGKLLHCQFPTLHFSERPVRKDPQCNLCGRTVS